MADPIIVKRVAQRLGEAADATPKDAEFWLKLAAIAADETDRVITVTQQDLPPAPFLAVVKLREGFRLVGRAATLVELTQPATDYFNEGGTGDLWLIEIKRVYSGA